MISQALLRMSIRLRSTLGERAATAVEYALIVALIAAVIVGIVVSIGLSTSSGFGTLNDNLEANKPTL